MTIARSTDSHTHLRSRTGLGTAILTILYVLFLVANLYDMNGSRGYKYIGYCLLIPLALYATPRLALTSKEILAVFILFIAFPSVGFGLGLASGAPLENVTSLSTPFLGVFAALATAPTLGAHRTLKYFYYVILTLAVILFYLTVLLYLGIANDMTSRIGEYVSAMITPYPNLRPNSILRSRIYFTATLWLVPAAVYFAKVKRFPFVMLCMTALILAASKGGTAIAFTIVSLTSLTKRYRKLGFLAVVLGSAGGLFFVPHFDQDVLDAFTGSETGLSTMRGDRALCEVELLANQPWLLAFGQGAGAEFYCAASDRWEFRIELDHLDAIRQHGLIWFGLFTSVCAMIIRRLLRSDDVEKKANGLALLSMYIAAGTNPQLITPLFMWYFGSCYLLSRQGNGYRDVAHQMNWPLGHQAAALRPARSHAGAALENVDSRLGFSAE